MTEITKSAFAKLIERSPSYITELRHKGLLVLTPNGKKILLEETVQRLRENDIQVNPGVAAMHAENRAKKGKGGDGDKPSESLAMVRAETLQFKNQLVMLGMALQQRHRFNLVDVQRELESIGDLVRSGLERLIDNSAPVLAATSGEQARRELIANELNALRRLVKLEWIKALRRLQVTEVKG